MSKNCIEYLLGIDGGGTKTEFLLTDTNRTELNRTVLGSSNPVNVGIDCSISVLQQGIEYVCKKIDLHKVSVFAGLAGGGNKQVKTSINNFLSSLEFGMCDNGSDTDNALYTALQGNDGIAVIMGTGIVAFGSFDGKLYRSGGWGYMIDSGGSGYHYGTDALNSALACVDGRGGSELLLNLIETKLKQPITDAVPEIYSRGPSFAASFAPIVFEAYKSGDVFAKEIIARNSAEVAKIINAANKNSQKECTDIVILGGLAKQKDIIEPFIKKHLLGKYNINFSNKAMVFGAVGLAKNLIER